MDEFEAQLAEDLREAGLPVRAGAALDGAVRRRVRRRQGIAAAMTALPVLLLLIGAAWLVNLKGHDAADVDVRDGIDDPAATTSDPPAQAPADPLTDALIALGAAVETAPDGAAMLGGAEWCGADEVFVFRPGSPIDDPAPAECLIAATTEGREAVLVRVQTTVEGDPIITVVRTTATVFVADVFTDSTQDSFGTPGWREQRCSLKPPRSGDEASLWDCEKPAPARDLPIAQVAPGETVTVTWPDQTAFGGADTVDLYLLGDVDPASGLRSWASSGTANRSPDGTITLTIVAPLVAARLEGPEFSRAAFIDVEPGIYELNDFRDRGNPVFVEITEAASTQWPEVTATPAIDPAMAILRAGGVGGVDFHLSRAATIAALEAEFRLPVTYTEFPGCVTTGYATVGDSLIVEFWGDDAGPDSGFAAWYYGGRNPFDSSEEPERLADIGLTTETGLGIGSPLGAVYAVGGGTSGGYDSSWGAAIWFESSSIAGELSRDATNPAAAVASITGGAKGAPARMVC